jgi:hypothetical protein
MMYGCVPGQRIVCVSIHTTFNGKVAQRQHHFDLLHDLLQRTVRPSDLIVIAGDLNCDVSHKEFHKITTHPCLSALSRVAVPSPTFNDKDGHDQTIDHVFHSPALHALRVDVEAVARGKPYGSKDPASGVASVVTGSDHSWVMVQFGRTVDTPDAVPEEQLAQLAQLARLERLANRLEAQVLALEATPACGPSSVSFDSVKATVLASLHDLHAVVTLEEAQRAEVRQLA